MSLGSFSYPFYTDSGTGLYGGVQTLVRGQNAVIAWDVTSNDLSSYDLYLYHQLTNVPGGSGLEVTSIASYSGNGTGNQRLTWNVTTFDSDYAASPIYYFWVNPSPSDGFTSAYFNISTPSVASTSSSITSSTSTSSSTSSSSIASTTGSSTSATTTPITTATPSTTAPASSSNSLSIGLGVGLGVGIPLVLALGIGIGIMIFKSRRKRSQGPVGDFQTTASEKKDPPYQPGYQDSPSYSNAYQSQQSGPHEVYAGPHLYEAPGKDNGIPTSPVEIGDRA